MKANFKSIILLLAIIVGVIFTTTFITSNGKAQDEFVYSELIELFDNDLVTSFVVDESNTIHVKAYVPKKDTNGEYVYENGSLVFELDRDGNRKITEYNYTFSYTLQVEQINDIAKQMLASGTSNLKEYDYKTSVTPWYVSYLPWLLIGISFVVLWFVMSKQMSGMGGGK